MSMLIAAAMASRAAGKSGRPSVSVLDECWFLLDSTSLAPEVVQLYRTARKRNSSVWGISQGGRPVTVEIPNLCDGRLEIDSDGRIFLVQSFTQSTGQLIERLIFVAQVTKSGEVFTERDEKGSPIVLERVRPFPFKAGRTEVRNGKVLFPETQQRPQLPTRSLAPLAETN